MKCINFMGGATDTFERLNISIIKKHIHHEKIFILLRNYTFVTN